MSLRHGTWPASRPYDVHMSDLQTGRAAPERLPAASWPAVVSAMATPWAPARAGPAPSCSTRNLKDQFEAFFARPDTLRALGVCNGCQMLAALAADDPRRTNSVAASSCATRASSSRRACRWSRFSSRPQHLLHRHDRHPRCPSPWHTARAGPTSASVQVHAKTGVLRAMRFVDGNGPAHARPTRPTPTAARAACAV